MKPARQQAAGPSFRAPQREQVSERSTFVACRCGVDMWFEWPEARDAVRCYGCGRRFLVPEHLPLERELPAFRPPDERPPALVAEVRRALTLPWLLTLALIALGAALLGTGVGFLLAR